MSSEICTAFASVGLDSDFHVGTLVRLVGLKKTQFNHHVGRVVNSMDERGRLGVLLHDSIFGNDSEVDGGRAHQYAPLSFSRANLRRVEHPTPGTEVSSVGTLPRSAVIRMFGETGWGLPDDVTDRVMQFLVLFVMTPSEVDVRSCSSSRGDFPLSAVLNSNEAEWWISSSRMPNGTGSEYLEFSFGGFRRISYVALKIPPLPFGPLSVRDFHLLALRSGMSGGEASESNAWVLASENPLQTLDRADLQEFALIPPCETESLRLVCTVNAAAAAAAEGGTSRRFADCIGLFQAAFA